MAADGRDTMLQVQVPDGIEEGQQFSVQTPQGVMLVICPAGNKGGDTIGIQTTPFQNASSSQVAPARAPRYNPVQHGRTHSQARLAHPCPPASPSLWGRAPGAYHRA